MTTNIRSSLLLTGRHVSGPRVLKSLTAVALACAATLALAAEPPALGPLSELPYSPSLDVSSIDPTVQPCETFYCYSCGGWHRANPIPSDQSDWSVYSRLHNENLRYLWALLLDAAGRLRWLRL